MEESLTSALCCLLGQESAIGTRPAVTLAAVDGPLAEVKLAQRRLNTAPLKWQKIFICRGKFDEILTLKNAWL